MQPSLFAPVRRLTAADACANAVRQAIVSGRLSPGVRLPPERTLATELGVNRVTLRSALHQLVAEGLIHQRQGQGTTVLDWRWAGGPGLLGAVIDTQADGPASVRAVSDLLAVRRALAVVVLEQLSGHGGPLDGVRAAVVGFEAVATAAEPDLNALAEADLAVIASLLEATGSPVLPLCLHPVARALAELPALRAAVYRAPLSNLAGWHATLTWLESGGVGPSRQQLLDLLAARDAETLAQMSAPQ